MDHLMILSPPEQDHAVTAAPDAEMAPAMPCRSSPVASVAQHVKGLDYSVRLPYLQLNVTT
ncbi:MAG: hypothetical protein ABR532_02585 [Candidatus Dormibacteria bacterium]